MAVSSMARTSPMAVMPEFKQAEQRIKAQSVNLAGTTKALEGMQGMADVAVGVSDGDSWGALASSVATVLALFGPYGRAAGVALTLIGLLADQIDKQGEANAKMAGLQTRLKRAVEGGQMLTDSAAERARKLADQARQIASRNFDAIISDLEKENAALQAEVAEKRASLANVEANLDHPAEDRRRASNQNDPIQKDRLRNDRLALDDALRRQKEVREILDKARAEKAAFLEKAADPPPDSDLGRILADGTVEQYSRTLAEARERVDECTGAVKEQAKAVGEDTRARAASEAAIKAQNAALAEGAELARDQMDAAGGSSEVNAERQEELKRFQNEVERISADLSGVLSDAVWNGLTGDGDTKSITEWFQNLFKKIANDALTTNIILPISTPGPGAARGRLFLGHGAPDQSGCALERHRRGLCQRRQAAAHPAGCQDL